MAKPGIASAVVFLELPHHAKFEPQIIERSKSTRILFVLVGLLVGHHLHDTLMPLNCIASTQLVIASNPRR